MRKAALVVAIVFTAILPGCGSQGIGGEASETLLPQAQGVRAAAEAGDLQTAAERLALLKIAALRLRQEGTLDEEAWQRVVQSADHVAAYLAAAAQSGQGEDSTDLRVPIEDLNPGVEQGPGGAAGGDEGRGGDEGDEGENGDKGRKGDKGDKGNKGDD
jgi:hypothetical protein